MVWGICVYFVYMIPLETDVLRKHRFQKCTFGYSFTKANTMNLNQTYPKVAVLSGFILFRIKARKLNKQTG